MYNEGQQNHIASFEMEMENTVDPPRRYRAAMSTFCWLLLIAVVLGMGATGIFFLVKKDETSVARAPDTSIPWGPSYSTRQEQFRAVLGSLSGFNELNDYSTPEYQALYWMANVDESGLDPESSDYSIIIERYVAALLYFSTNGGQWTNQFHFLSASSICEWNDIVVIGPSAKTMKRGILCNDKGRVNTIDLSNNNINGSLPWEIASLESIHALRAPHNQVQGSLPSQLGLLSMLKFLDLNNNAITEEIPSNFGFLSNLKHLKLKKNQIEGTIPLAIGQLPKLTHLSLSKNQLSGGLVSNFEALTSLDVSHNYLEGTVPSTLSGRDWVLFDVSFNNFQDNLDDQGFCPGGAESSTIFADCLGENADVQCSCCTCCSDDGGCQE